MAKPLVAMVEADYVPGKYSPHQSSDGNFPCTEEEVSMIWQKCPGIAGRLGFQQNSPQPFKKILTISIVPEDVSTLNTPDNDVVQNSESVKAS